MRLVPLLRACPVPCAPLAAFLLAAVVFCTLRSSAQTAHTWERHDDRTVDEIHDFLWTGAQFLAVGERGAIFQSLDADYGTILTSPDGLNWTPQTSNTSDHLRSDLTAVMLLLLTLALSAWGLSLISSLVKRKW